MFNRRMPQVTDRKVLVSLVSGNALSGVCTHAGPEGLVLRGVMVHEPGTDPAPADGEVLVDRINVDYIQIL